MATVGEQINGALRLIGQLAEGEVPSSETANDALTAFNQMLDSWSTERLSVYSTQDQVFTWPASTSTRTLGPTGDFVGNRPILLDDATYYRDVSNGVSFPITIINESEYNSIALKTSTSSYPQAVYPEMTAPDMRMSIYPVPTRELEWHFISVSELVQPAALATTLLVPPGYLRAFRYNLAVEIASEFGIEPPPNVARIAMASKRTLKRINNPGDVLVIPDFLAGPARFNIFVGS